MVSPRSPRHFTHTVHLGFSKLPEFPSAAKGILIELCHCEGARLWHNSFFPKLTAFQMNLPLSFAFYRMCKHSQENKHAQPPRQPQQWDQTKCYYAITTGKPHSPPSYAHQAFLSCPILCVPSIVFANSSFSNFSLKIWCRSTQTQHLHQCFHPETEREREQDMSTQFDLISPTFRLLLGPLPLSDTFLSTREMNFSTVNSGLVTADLL